MQETTNGGNNLAVGPSNFLLVLKHRAIIIIVTSAIANCWRVHILVIAREWYGTLAHCRRRVQEQRRMEVGIFPRRLLHLLS